MFVRMCMYLSVCVHRPPPRTTYAPPIVNSDSNTNTHTTNATSTPSHQLSRGPSSSSTHSHFTRTNSNESTRTQTQKSSSARTHVHIQAAISTDTQTRAQEQANEATSPVSAQARSRIHIQAASTSLKAPTRFYIPDAQPFGANTNRCVHTRTAMPVCMQLRACVWYLSKQMQCLQYQFYSRLGVSDMHARVHTQSHIHIVILCRSSADAQALSSSSPSSPPPTPPGRSSSSSSAPTSFTLPLQTASLQVSETFFVSLFVLVSQRCSHDFLH